MADEDSPQRLKKRRISRACDYCHQRSKKCKASSNDTRCQNCVAFDQKCTFDRPQKRRGAPRRSDARDGQQAAIPPRTNPAGSSGLRESGIVHQLPEEHQTIPLRPDGNLASEHTSPASFGTISTYPWRAPNHYSHATVIDLVELFFEIVYPIFPFFHQPSFIRRISRAEYTSDTSLFSVTMAVCALVSARVRDGAVFNPRWNVRSLQLIEPEVYYNEAVRQVGDTSRSDLNTLRTHAVLALAAIQEGKVRDMHGHLGHYHTIVATEGLQDENNWPAEIGIVEIQERRRLFWSIYTLDIFTSIVWGGVIRSREYQSSVSYPSEIDDDMFDDSGFAGSVLPLSTMGNSSSEDGSMRSDSISWMAGRNFVIDLYRVLEHIIMRLSVRKSRAQRQTLIDGVLRASDSLSQEAVIGSVLQMYANLPQCLKETKPITSKARLDRFGFQAADIIATVQLLRMILLSATGASICEKCQIANEVVSAFSSIPTAYHHAISVPLLFHLGVIGQILATTLEQQLSENDYRSIRNVMMAMARLLSTLEGLHASKGASQRLKEQITRIDEYMTLQRHSSRGDHGSSAHMDPAPQILQEAFQERPANAFGTSPASTFDSQTVGETLDLSPFQLPPDILGDVSQIFDFSGLPWNMT